ncbi:MAG: hypothetical protein AABX72_03275 [Nanoarchaeota archaeon]
MKERRSIVLKKCYARKRRKEGIKNKKEIIVHGKTDVKDRCVRKDNQRIPKEEGTESRKLLKKAKKQKGKALSHGR